MESILIIMKEIQRFDEFIAFGYVFSMIWRKMRENREVHITYKYFQSAFIEPAG